MADSSAGWVAKCLDYTCLGCVLLGAEEGIRSLVIALFHVGDHVATLPWQAWSSALLIGYALSFLGEKGAKMWHSVAAWIKEKVGSKGAVPEYAWEVFNATVTIDDPVPEENTAITFKHKIRIYLTNVTGKEIQVWTPIWQSNQVEAQYSSTAAPGSRFRIKGNDGNWVTEKRLDGYVSTSEYSCIELKPGRACDCYVGLEPRKNQNLKEMWRTRSPIGTAVFALKIEGKLYVKSIKV